MLEQKPELHVPRRRTHLPGKEEEKSSKRHLLMDPHNLTIWISNEQDRQITSTKPT